MLNGLSDILRLPLRFCKKRIFDLEKKMESTCFCNLSLNKCFQIKTLVFDQSSKGFQKLLVTPISDDLCQVVSGRGRYRLVSERGYDLRDIPACISIVIM